MRNVRVIHELPVRGLRFAAYLATTPALRSFSNGMVFNRNTSTPTRFIERRVSRWGNIQLWTNNRREEVVGELVSPADVEFIGVYRTLSEAHEAVWRAISEAARREQPERI